MPGINIPNAIPYTFINKKFRPGYTWLYTTNASNNNPPIVMFLNFIIRPVITRAIARLNKISKVGLLIPLINEIATCNNHERPKTAQIIFTTLPNWVSYPILCPDLML